MNSIVYPTGRTVDYHRSVCACSIDSVLTTYNANTVTLLSNLTYRPFGIAKGMDNGSGGTVDNVFDQSGRLTVANPGADKEQTYAYDAVSNLTSVTSPNVAWYNRVFGYDALNRIEHAEGPWGVIDYTYDGVGNRLTKVVNSQTTTYSYTPGTNRLQETTGPVSYTYDANGNITGIGSKVLTYNQNNRLIRVEKDSNILGEYVYNGLGQRVIKSANNVTTVFHYDFDGNIIAESDENGNFVYEYLYKGSTRLALVNVISGEMFSYLNDRLGTPLMLTDSTNTVVWEGIYKPFGEAEVNPNSSVVNNFRFAGQYYDGETRLHYNYPRYYDPSTGRYMTPDPLSLSQIQIACQSSKTLRAFIGNVLLYKYVLSSPLSKNLYTYSENNPTNKIDMLGLAGFGIEAGGGVGIGGYKDANSTADTAASGIYIGAKPNGYAELGAYTYKAKTKIGGAKLGLGVTLVIYWENAEKFFKGITRIESMSFGPFTQTWYYNECGEEIGRSFSFLGKGGGVAYEKGESEGMIFPLQ